MVVRSPTPFELGQNGCWPSQGSQLPQALPSYKPFFAVLPPERLQKGSLFKIGRLFSLLLAFLFFFLLMSGKVHSHPGPVFLCSVCVGNVTRMNRSMQCCIYSKWVHLRCLLCSFSGFKTLGSSHSWNCLSCCAPASSGDPTLTNTVSSSSDSSSLFTFTVLPDPSGPLCYCNTLIHPRLQNSYPPSADLISYPSAPSPPLHVSGCFFILSASSSP